jgi:outer membrane protein TolC
VREARAERGVTRSELFPQVNAGSGYSRSRITFLTALEEVENALVSFGKEQNRYRSLKDSETARQRSLDLAEQQYRSGVLGFLDVLEAEQSLHAAESQRVQSEGALCSDLVRLYKSLGGGWNATRAADDGVAAAGKP